MNAILETMKQSLLDTGEYSPEELTNPYDILNYTLEWEGICGYTEDIIEWVSGYLEEDRNN